MTGTTISSGSVVGLDLGTLGNPVYVAAGVTISGTNFALTAAGAGSVVNSGTLATTNTSGHGYAYSGGWTPTTAGVIAAGGTIANAATGLIASYFEGVGLTATGTVTNAGTINTTSTAQGFGVVLAQGGSITNATGGVISSGYQGVITFKQATSILNQGVITGLAGIGVNVRAGGSVTNAAAGQISGGAEGILLAGAAPTAVTNVSGGTITGGKTGLLFDGGGGAINNAGLIVGNTGYGVEVLDGAAVTNQSGGTITGRVLGVFATGTADTIVNAGVMLGTGFAGAYLQNGGVLTNTTGGYVAGYSFGLLAVGTAATAINSGTIKGVAVTGSGGGLLATDGIRFTAGGVVRNLTGGTISGGYTALDLRDGTVSVYNQGTIRAADAVGQGVYIGTTGATTAAPAGVLRSAIVTNTSAGSILGNKFGVQIVGTAGTVINGGSILAAKYPSSYPFKSYGVRLATGGSVINNAGGYIHSTWMGVQGIGSSTVFNQGTIRANDTIGDGAGLWINGPALITNAPGGVIRGGGFAVVVYNQTTLLNQGTITGTSFAFDAANAAGFSQLVIDTPGAVFGGVIDGGNTIGSTVTSTFELATGSGIGTVSNIGTVVNFAQIAIDAGATWAVGGIFSAGETLTFGGANSTLILANPTAARNAMITGFTNTDTIVLSGLTDVTGLSFNGNTLTVSESLSAGLQLVFNTPSALNFGVVNGSTDLFIPCFLPGTLIRTDRGEVPVEALSVGARIETVSGRLRQLCWIGQGKALATRNRRSAATPVIVRKGALADNVPHQDLRITKGHSLYLDGVLIPAEFLVNHRSILWDDRAQEVTVFHLELDEHDVLLANGAPAESYRDDGNRWLFQNANSGWDQPAKPACAPVLTGGSEVDAIWRRLLDRAGPRPGVPLTDDPDLHLLVDGRRVDVTGRRGPLWVFSIEGRPGDVRIVSREAVPAELGLVRDPRPLGVAIRSITVRAGGQSTLVAAADERLTDGFHGYEPDDDLRWTDGLGSLPSTVLADGCREIVLHIAGTTQYLLEGDRVAA